MERNDDKVFEIGHGEIHLSVNEVSSTSSTRWNLNKKLSASFDNVIFSPISVSKCSCFLFLVFVFKIIQDSIAMVLILVATCCHGSTFGNPLRKIFPPTSHFVIISHLGGYICACCCCCYCCCLCRGCCCC